MIVTDRLVLRPFRQDDLPVMRNWFSNPETMRFWGQSQPDFVEPNFESDLQGRFRAFDEVGYFAIEVKDGSFIGRIEFEGLDEIDRSCEVMIMIGEASARGHGYGKEAMVGLLSYLFNQRGMHRVQLTVLAWNEAAIHSYESAGFVTEGRLRSDLSIDGERHDQLVMSVLEGEFRARWSTLIEAPVTPNTGT
jgi:RimJ/RimL family protein N-acetyltransferase